MTAETLESLRASFNRRLRAEGKADRTLVLYGQSINYFSEFLAQEGLRADLDNLTRDNVLIWLVSLRTRKLTDGTIRTRWRGIRRFVGWLVDDEELTALLDACKGKTFVDLRDAAVIRLLLDCGMRVSELTGIDLADLDLDGETVSVTGKGSRTRQAYYGSKTAVLC
jgi:site-specific recombinase XerC